MVNYDFDLFIIGAGSGGVRAARVAARLGAKVAIAESQYLGGTCVNVGCVPKKFLHYAAHFSEDFEDAVNFGWTIKQPCFDWSNLIKNKNREIKRLNQIYQNLLEKNKVTLFHGWAKVNNPHQVTINNQSYTAERILIATGGVPFIPDIPGKEHITDSNGMFFLETLPEKIIIIGGGYISVEFASILNGLGSQVTLIYRGDSLLQNFDRELRQALESEMVKRGIILRANVEVKAIEKQAQGLNALLHNGERLQANKIMYAIGRRPNTENLGLAELGVSFNPTGGIIVNDFYQSTITSIYAIGDVIQKISLTPVATAEAMILAHHLYEGSSTILDYTNIPTCVFSQPNLATVGFTEDQAKEKLGDIKVYRTQFRPLKHTISDRDERTFMKLIVDKTTDKVVGAHMLGSEAGEIIQGIAIAIKAGATKALFDSTIGIHPTAAEEFVTMRDVT
ncbi:glutathione-disulfide reductase [Candidatus Nitrosacidococcus sp. I8]|uniref:glutathione-disulfide reductase n=1 Tax=Candidatus Nitrosacidococcus sp. I8 TaxID=2942908 RepID=UPI002225DACB|nr:glutathione-disulfide reductase [Candidatus Nitrosacidococcus sp. I8]CAH9018578.1 Glutathione amide reductase [Candidatus Nitrosacidococcus sp. I8]